MNITLDAHEIAIAIAALEEAIKSLEQGRDAATRLNIPYPDGCTITIDRAVALRDRLRATVGLAA